MKTIKRKSVLLAIVVCFAVFCGAFMLLETSTAPVLAHENDTGHEHGELCCSGIENYIGYGCKDGVDIQENVSGKTMNYLLEATEGFGCDSSCGPGREDGDSHRVI